MMTMDGTKVEPQSGVVGLVGGGGASHMGNNNNNNVIGTATNSANNQSPQTNNQLCAGCGKHIQDRFLLRALDMLWHEDCLKCGCCDCRLGEVGSTLYTKGNLMLCKRDYLRLVIFVCVCVLRVTFLILMSFLCRLFGSTGFCAACNKVIPAFEMVMRARSNVYHLECFACQQCNHRYLFPAALHRLLLANKQ